MVIMPLKKSTKLTKKEFVNGDRKKQAFNKLSIPRKQKETKENVSSEQEESCSAKNWMRQWIHERRGKCLLVSRKLIMKKTVLTNDEMVGRGESTENFKASVGWLRHFMKRYGLSLRRKTSMAQKDPDQVIDKLVAFVLHVRRIAMKHQFKAFDIIATVETPIWTDMVSDTTVDVTGKKTVTVKITGHEKSRVSVCLAAKADRTK